MHSGTSFGDKIVPRDRAFSLMTSFKNSETDDAPAYSESQLKLKLSVMDSEVIKEEADGEMGLYFEDDQKSND